jgi:hypothetical protein
MKTSLYIVRASIVLLLVFDVRWFLYFALGEYTATNFMARYPDPNRFNLMNVEQVAIILALNALLLGLEIWLRRKRRTRRSTG